MKTKTIKEIGELSPFEKEVNIILETLLYSLITKEQAIQKIISIKVGGEMQEECDMCEVKHLTGNIRPRTVRDCLENCNG
jgi:hypothetical protein